MYRGRSLRGTAHTWEALPRTANCAKVPGQQTARKPRVALRQQSSPQRRARACLAFAPRVTDNGGVALTRRRPSDTLSLETWGVGRT
jgi:hypothetical protein